MAEDARKRLREQGRIPRGKILIGLIALAVIIFASVMIEKNINGKITDVTIKKSSITDRKAVFIPIKQLDTNIIAVKASDGTYRLAFDDCIGCYYQYGKHSGFKNNKDNSGIVCKTCGCEIFYDDMGFMSEECMAYPIAESEIESDDDYFVIPAHYLEAKKSILESWRSGSLVGAQEQTLHRGKKQ